MAAATGQSDGSSEIVAANSNINFLLFLLYDLVVVVHYYYF